MERTCIDRSYRAVRRELRFDVGYADFIRALESLLGRMNVDALPEIARETQERAREKLAAVVGLSGFALFQRIDHGALSRVFGGHASKARTYVFGNALIAVEMTK